MREEIANIWDYHSDGKWIVITTNIGWKKDLSNPMGSGIARAAANLFPDLPSWYGSKCMSLKENVGIQAYLDGRMLMFPTKSLNKNQPWLSWRSDSSINLIIDSAKKLQIFVDNNDNIFGDIAIPLVGCSNGNLRSGDVVPLLHQLLSDRFVLVESKMYK